MHYKREPADEYESLIFRSLLILEVKLNLHSQFGVLVGQARYPFEVLGKYSWKAS